MSLPKAGLDVNGRDKSEYSSSPLHLAVWNKNPGVIQVPLKAGADINARNRGGDTPLHLAVWNRNPGVIQVPLKAGADINARDKDGHTPLRLAAVDNDNVEVAQALTKAGAK